MAPPPMNGPRFNEFIQSPKVRVIDQDGENLGVMYTREAMEQAMDAGLDLVEISPNADPPVAKYIKANALYAGTALERLWKVAPVEAPV